MKKKRHNNIILSIMDELKLYIDRLKACEYKEFAFISVPEIMKIDEKEDKEVYFQKNISVKGRATIAIAGSVARCGHEG